MSGLLASRFFAVSRRLSPFTTDDEEPEMLMMSAESHFPAISKEVRVRVEGSRKRLTTVFPRRAGTFLISRVAISLRDSAVSRTRRISPGSSSRIVRRSFLRQPIVLFLRLLFRFLDHHAILTILFPEEHLDQLAPAGGEGLPDVVGAGGKPRGAPVHEDRELDERGAPQTRAP